MYNMVDIEISVYSGIKFINGLLFTILLYSNIILCVIFFLMARNLIRYSKIFESQDKALKIGIEKFKNKLEIDCMTLQQHSRECNSYRVI